MKSNPSVQTQTTETFKAVGIKNFKDAVESAGVNESDFRNAVVIDANTSVEEISQPVKSARPKLSR